MLCNLILSSEARKKGFCTEIDSDENGPDCGIFRMIQKMFMGIFLVAFESKLGLHKADINVPATLEAHVSSQETVDIWHHRLGHITNKVIKKSVRHVKVV